MKTVAIRLMIICTCILYWTFLFNNKIQAQCTVSGPRSGTIFSDDNSTGSFAFSSPGNAVASDNNRAIASATISILTGNTHYLKATGFGFSIPASASICGIQVEVEKNAANVSILAWIIDNSVRLLKNGTPAGSDYAKAGAWPTSESYYTYGSTSDYWGLGAAGWTPANINAANFGVIFSSSITGIFGLLPSSRINHIQITVSYLDGVLPLSLTNFSALALDNHSAKIDWTTTNNNEETLFSVQRSSDGHSWATIYNQRNSISQHDQTWHYTDMNYQGETAYYRLQVQQASGKTTYSSIEKVRWQSTTGFNLYPNPATDHLIIEQTEPLQSVRCASIDGSNWKLTYRQTDIIHYQIDVRSLPRGTYILCINEKRKLFLLE
jgi:hypothetical protein